MRRAAVAWTTAALVGLVIMLAGCGGSEGPATGGEGVGGLLTEPLTGQLAELAGARGRIAFADVKQGTIWVMNANGTNAHALPGEGCGEPDLRADGAKVAFIRFAGNYSELWVMSANGTSAKRLTRRAKDRFPAWSPDGKKIAFVRVVGWTPYIYVVNADGTQLREIIHVGPQAVGGSNGCNHPDWSPDGTKLVFIRNDANYFSGVCTANADGTGVRQLTDPHGDILKNDYEPAWSPDGQRIAFVRGTDLRTIRADGGDDRLLAAIPGTAEMTPCWSPDGTQVLFRRLWGWRSELFSVYADGTHLLRRTQHTRAAHPSWAGPS